MHKLVAMKGPRILLIVGGGIAAYKSCELVRLIRRAGGDMQLAQQMHRQQYGKTDITPSLGETREELVGKYPEALERMAKHSAPHCIRHCMDKAKGGTGHGK